jgi:hypothetical protein
LKRALLAVLIGIVAACAWSHEDVTDAHTHSFRVQADGPSTFTRQLQGTMEWMRPDGGVRARAIVSTKETDQRDGGFVTEDQGLDLRALDLGKTAPAIPVFRIAGALAALAVVLYGIIRWRWSVAKAALLRALQPTGPTPPS